MFIYPGKAQEKKYPKMNSPDIMQNSGFLSEKKCLLKLRYNLRGVVWSSRVWPTDTLNPMCW